MATRRLNVRTAGVHSDEIQAQPTSFDEGSVDKCVQVLDRGLMDHATVESCEGARHRRRGRLQPVSATSSASFSTTRLNLALCCVLE